MAKIKEGTGSVETLRMLALGPLWDGDLPSKRDRDLLVKNGLSAKHDGWNIITVKGVRYLVDLGIMD